MKTAAKGILTGVVLTWAVWLTAYVTQPQPFEGWSEADKLAYVHMYVPALKWRLDAANESYFCDTELHILMRRSEFLGIHLPSKDKNGYVYECEYWLDIVEVPWLKYSKT